MSWHISCLAFPSLPQFMPHPLCGTNGRPGRDYYVRKTKSARYLSSIINEIYLTQTFLCAVSMGMPSQLLNREYPGLRYRKFHLKKLGGSSKIFFPASVSCLPMELVAGLHHTRQSLPGFGTASRLQYRFCAGTLTPFLVSVAAVAAPATVQVRAFRYLFVYPTYE